VASSFNLDSWRGWFTPVKRLQVSFILLLSLFFAAPSSAFPFYAAAFLVHIISILRPRCKIVIDFRTSSSGVKSLPCRGGGKLGLVYSLSFFLFIMLLQDQEPHTFEWLEM
jgi:hypothetical protein